MVNPKNSSIAIKVKIRLWRWAGKYSKHNIKKSIKKWLDCRLAQVLNKSTKKANIRLGARMYGTE